MSEPELAIVRSGAKITESRDRFRRCDAMIARLEHEINAADSVLPPLKNFILPGGVEAAARLHIARTICRRAERLVVAFVKDHSKVPVIVTYLNRLSDWLFVQARLANHRAGVADVPWRKR